MHASKTSESFLFKFWQVGLLTLISSLLLTLFVVMHVWLRDHAWLEDELQRAQPSVTYLELEAEIARVETSLLQQAAFRRAWQQSQMPAARQTPAADNSEPG